ncbi:Bug family tripartite tricarboxylate transporter substrate binding protein [Oceaniglobus trochenteri]|uniref:Bug family tripartite tricarboxylate transporter substrate binding protein n=1 Tax=Oceaniglobus trochenteri TaxID=2763260 RepID=UPI001D00118A|nr:tripartite tricarboxylate transporter substrate binding protein [Oceaniglobus trochenteri]
MIHVTFTNRTELEENVNHPFSRLTKHMVGLAMAAATLMGANSAAAQDFPEKPITIVVGFNAGGAQDIMARALASAFTAKTGNQAAVVNKPGASSMIGAKFVADQVPDGHTIFVGSVGIMVLQKLLGKTDISFFDDFANAGIFSETLPTVAVPASSDIQSVSQLIATSKEKPGELRWAHPGPGSTFYWAGLGFAFANDMDVKGVPFSGGVNVRNALLADQVDFAIVGEAISRGFEDKIRILAAVTDSRRALLNDDIATFDEIGVDYLPYRSPVAIMMRSDLSQDIKDYYVKTMHEVIESDEFIELMEKSNMPITYMSPKESLDLARELEKNAKLLMETTQ